MACSICRIETLYPQEYATTVEVLRTTTKETHCIKVISQLYGFIKLLVLVWFPNVVYFHGTCV